MLLFSYNSYAFDFGTTRYDNLSNNRDDPKFKLINSYVKQLNELVINKKWKDIYPICSKEYRDAISEDQCVAQWEVLNESTGTIKNIYTKEIHLVESTSKGRVPIDGKSIILPNPIKIIRPVAGTLSFILCIAENKDTATNCWLTYVLNFRRRNNLVTC